MQNLSFNLFDDGVPQSGRILLFFRFETAERIVRSGLLNYDVTGRRFTGPVKNAALLAEAERYLLETGHVTSGTPPSSPAAKLTAVAS